MGLQVVSGAITTCCMGSAPSSLIALPISFSLVMNMPAATINAYVPFLNILPFGMCNSPNNPMVIAATVAALGIPTPAPCLPMTMAPWAPGSPTVLLDGVPALNNSSMLTCMWGGVIQINFAGQTSTIIP